MTNLTGIVSEHIERADKRRMGFIWHHLWMSVLVAAADSHRPSCAGSAP